MKRPELPLDMLKAFYGVMAKCGPQRSLRKDPAVLELFFKISIPPGLKEVTG